MISKKFSYFLIPMLAFAMFGVGLSACRDLMLARANLESAAHCNDIDDCRTMCGIGEHARPGLITIQTSAGPGDPPGHLAVLPSKTERFAPPAPAGAGTLHAPPHESRGDVYLQHSSFLI